MESGENSSEAMSENSSSPQLTQRKKKSKVKDKRRFSDEQIRSLETIFEEETKLEPRKKLQVAKELGLHPRQVAIWFQNKRARWKSKQIEQEYRKLQTSYDSLASQFESLKKEKQSLIAQLQKLGELLEKPDVNEDSRILEGSGSENGEQDFKDEATQGNLHVRFMDNVSSGQKNENVSDFGHEAQELPSVDEYAENFLASPEKWCPFDEGSMIDQPYNSLHWMNFWT